MKLKRYIKYLSGLLIAALIGLAQPGFATTTYVDLVSGNDTTGNGTAGNPYLTVDKGANGLSGGDEVRVKKNTVTALTGTLAFVNGSATINTSADLTAVLAAGDVISKNSGNEAWWRVASLTSSAITLNANYYGSTETVTGYYATPTLTINTEWDGIPDGSSVSSRLKITGGWDLSTETRDGYTFVTHTGLYGAVYISSTCDYIEVSYFVATSGVSASTYGALKFNGDYIYVHHCYGAGYLNTSGCVIYSDYGTFENLILSGDTPYALSLDNANACYFKDIYLYNSDSPSYSVLGINQSSMINLENIYIYQGGNYGVTIDYCHNLYFKNIIIDGFTNSGFYANYFSDYIHLADSTISNCDEGVYAANYLGREAVYLKNITFSGNTTNIVVNSQLGSTAALRVYGTDTDGYSSFSKGEDLIISEDTTEDRSGSCIKITPTGLTVADGKVQAIKVGTVKVASDSGDMTLAVYMKDDASFNGQVFMYALQDGVWIDVPVEKTLTTSYAQYSITVDDADLTVGEYIDLYVSLSGTAGNIYIDDFSATQ